MNKATMTLLAVALLGLSPLAASQSLQGSRASMQRQHQEAVSQGYGFMQTSQSVTAAVNKGELVKVMPNRYFVLHDVSFPYAKPEVKMFVERLAGQYFGACGEKLTVTSLTRPINRQPANAAKDSVHPTGMAIDLRVPSKSSCRSWLERVLLSLEAAEVLDVTLERYPPHYHVAVFPPAYSRYVASLDSSSEPQDYEYVVRSGDSLFLIAKRTGSTVAKLRAANSLRSDVLQIGQKLWIPGDVPVSNPTAAIASAPAQSSPSQMEEMQAAAVGEITHQVRRGETLWRIARRYGTTAAALINDNELAGDLLQVGQELKVRMEVGSR